MAPFDKSKRSVVKHKTHKPFAGGGGGSGRGAGDRGEGSSSAGSRGKARGGGGFKVGPRHAPDGAYLGKAKRIKANLIANAKTKQRFYKSVKGKGTDEGAGGHALDDTPASLGRFAPEAPAASEGRSRTRGRGGGDDGEGEESRRRTSRAGPPPPGSDDEAGESSSARQGRRRDRAGPPPPGPRGTKRGRDQAGDDNKDAPAATPSRPPPPKYASREEALAARQERQEKWNKASGSETGRRRGQPDLGSRMEVLLDKIRAT